jgi:hypothetical protein
MKTTIDAGGRLVTLREALKLAAGMPLEISKHDGAILIEPVPTLTRLPWPHRILGEIVVAFLADNFKESPLVLPLESCTA